MSFYTSLSGLRAAQTDLSVISNNVANAGTTGFKKSRAEFADLVSGAVPGGQIGFGTRTDEITQNFSQGTYKNTERTLDVAISGDGMFVVRGTDGQTSYTRDGAFGMNPSDRTVRDETGAVLQVMPVDANGAVSGTSTQSLTIPATSGTDGTFESLAIDEKGLVTATYSNGDVQNLGRIALARVTNPEGLRQIGNGHWVVSGTSGPAQINAAGEGGAGSTQSGALEQANVDLTDELVSLIAAQRNFQANAKAIETANAMTQTVVNLRS